MSSLFMPFMVSVPVPSNSFSPIIPTPFTAVLRLPFLPLPSILYLFFCPLHASSFPSDPDQNSHELVYDLRSQCDAIRVTKTVRPYRMVICPVNENNAALTVSDGRVMLWELKSHAGKATANPRYGSTHTGTKKGKGEKNRQRCNAVL